MIRFYILLLYHSSSLINLILKCLHFIAVQGRGAAAWGWLWNRLGFGDAKAAAIIPAVGTGINLGSTLPAWQNSLCLAVNFVIFRKRVLKCSVKRSIQ